MIEAKTVDSVRGITVTIGIEPVLGPRRDQRRWVGIVQVPMNEPDAVTVPGVVNAAQIACVGRFFERQLVVVRARRVAVRILEPDRVVTDPVDNEVDEDFDAARVRLLDEAEKLGLDSEP